MYNYRSLHYCISDIEEVMQDLEDAYISWFISFLLIMCRKSLIIVRDYLEEKGL